MFLRPGRRESACEQRERRHSTSRTPKPDLRGDYLVVYELLLGSRISVVTGVLSQAHALCHACKLYLPSMRPHVLHFISVGFDTIYGDEVAFPPQRRPHPVVGRCDDNAVRIQWARLTRT